MNPQCMEKSTSKGRHVNSVTLSVLNADLLKKNKNVGEDPNHATSMMPLIW